ncbi:MAG: M55 family metallopeptidase, partial [Chloroflexi bacterium]|nr:M55 family metallopeptidase [Chloroflexota bacterium]
IGLDAALAGHFGVPVIMLSGDQSASKEAQELIGHDVEVAVVKKAHGRYSADLTPIPVAQEKICEAAARAVTRLRNGNAPKPFVIPPPVKLTIEFARTDFADRAQLAPGAQRFDGRKVEVTLPDMIGAYQAMRALVMLAGE